MSQEAKEIIVTFRATQASAPQGQPGVPATPENAKPAEQLAEDASEAQRSLSTITVQLAEKALSQAIGTAVSSADYYMTRAFVLRDDYKGGKDYQYAKAVVSSFAQDAGNVVAWARMGGLAGPIGAAVGAGVGVAVTAVQRSLEAARAYEQQAIRIRQMEASLSFNRARAGWEESE